MSAEQTILVGDYIAFRRGKVTLVGTIIGMDHASRPDRRRRVIIKPPSKTGQARRSNVTVFYSAIIGLAERAKEEREVTP